jgi:hypothetical protein
MGHRWKYLNSFNDLVSSKDDRFRDGQQVTCEERGSMQDRANPYARERAIVIARQNPPIGVSPNEVVTAVADVLDSMGDICPQCPPAD